MGLLKSLLPKPLRDYSESIKKKIRKNESEIKLLKSKIRTLEDAIDILIKNPAYTKSEQIGFNGQNVRKQIFNTLISNFNFENIIETGTWTGNTTGYMAEMSNLPVFSTEINERYYSLSKMRLSDFSNIEIECSDSIEFIKGLIAKPKISKKCSFFYLDAHGYRDPPLREEINLISEHWYNFVIMIDDFQVVGDEGYGYLAYGNGHDFTIGYIENILQMKNIAAFFPSTSSSQETGRKRGCIVLSRKGHFSKKLENMNLLRKHQISNENNLFATDSSSH